MRVRSEEVRFGGWRRVWLWDRRAPLKIFQSGVPSGPRLHSLVGWLTAFWRQVDLESGMQIPDPHERTFWTDRERDSSISIGLLNEIELTGSYVLGLRGSDLIFGRSVQRLSLFPTVSSIFRGRFRRFFGFLIFLRISRFFLVLGGLEFWGFPLGLGFCWACLADFWGPGFLGVPLPFSFASRVSTFFLRSAIGFDFHAIFLEIFLGICVHHGLLTSDIDEHTVKFPFVFLAGQMFTGDV